MSSLTKGVEFYVGQRIFTVTCISQVRIFLPAVHRVQKFVHGFLLLICWKKERWWFLTSTKPFICFIIFNILNFQNCLHHYFFLGFSSYSEWVGNSLHKVIQVKIVRWRLYSNLPLYRNVNILRTFSDIPNRMWLSFRNEAFEVRWLSNIFWFHYWHHYLR